MKCASLTHEGKQCKAMALNDEDRCIFHSQSERAKSLRSKRRPLTKEDALAELRNQLRKVKHSEADPVEISKEVRMLLEQIWELQEDIEPEKRGEEEQQTTQKRKPFEEAVREAQRKIDKEEKERDNKNE